MNITLTEETTTRINYLADCLNIAPVTVVESWFNFLVDGELIDGFLNPVDLVNALGMHDDIDFKKEVKILADNFAYYRDLTDGQLFRLRAMANSCDQDLSEYIRYSLHVGKN